MTKLLEPHTLLICYKTILFLFSYSFPAAKQKIEASGAASSAAKDDDDADEDDFELFGEDDVNDEAAEKLKQERLAAYEAKKAKSL